MSDTDPQGDIAANSATSFIVAVPYQGGNGPVPGSYAQLLRMGAWDTTIETGLVTSDGKTFYTTTGKNSIYQGSDPLQDKGMLAYSADQYTVYSPQVRMVGRTSSSSWSNQNMTVTTSGDKVTAYTYSGPLGIKASYQNQNTIAMTFGYNCNFVLGSSISASTINNASTGMGGRLSSNFGLTQNLYDGQTVTINGSAMAVQGIGATSVNESSSTLAASSITLAVNPAASTTTMTAARLLGQITRFAGDGVVGLGATSINVATTVSTAALRDGESAISDAVKGSYDAALAVSAAIVAIQAIASLAGITMSVAAKGLQTATTSGSLSLGVAQSTLSQGMDARLALAPAYVLLSADVTDIKATTALSIASGQSKILLTDVGIFLECGPSKIEITDTGIQATGPTTGFNP
jgi:hypothetical protein